MTKAESAINLRKQNLKFISLNVLIGGIQHWFGAMMAERTYTYRHVRFSAAVSADESHYISTAESAGQSA